MGFSERNLTILPSQLTHLLQRCSTSKALKQGKQLHQQLISNAYTPNPFLTTKLIQMYADCNDLVSAHHLFDKLPQPNVFAWTGILAYYSRNGFYNQCLLTYRDMQIKGVTPDRYVFPKVIRACAQSLLIKAGGCVHKDVIRFGVQANLQVCNSLIGMYSKWGDLASARRVFDEMEERDLLSWNSMISGCVSKGFVELGLELLHSMSLDGVEPDLVSWNTIMDGYCRMGELDEARRIFEHIEEPNIISWTTLISGYSRIGKHDMALVTFRNMMHRGGVFPDSDALSNVLVSCRILGAHLNGREIHGYGIKMQASLEFYSSAGAALLTMYARCGRGKCAGNVFELMDKTDVVTWNAMILGYLHLRMDDFALTCFSQLQSRGIKSDEVTLSTLLPACDLKLGEQIHAHIRRKDFGSAIPVWNALINMYSKNGCAEDAYTVFADMGKKDIVSWNTMIGGYAMHGDGTSALQLFQDMCHAGIQPNTMTFTSVLSACSHSGLVDEGLQVFNSLTQEYGVTLTMEQFACVVDLLARAGRLEDAVYFINKMPIKADNSIWGSVLAACQAYQNINIGKIAAEHLFCLEPENAGNYITLSNIYARAGRWSDATSVRKLMESGGLLKPSGYSWVESEK